MHAIQITVRNVYGNDLIYPANDAAQILANIAGTKTLSLSNLDAAKALGHAIVEVNSRKIIEVDGRQSLVLHEYTMRVLS